MAPVPKSLPTEFGINQKLEIGIKWTFSPSHGNLLLLKDEEEPPLLQKANKKSESLLRIDR